MIVRPAVMDGLKNKKQQNNNQKTGCREMEDLIKDCHWE